MSTCARLAPSLSRLALALAVLLVTVAAAAAQARHPILDSGRRIMQAQRLREEERIVLDGRLDEPAWQRAEPATDFIQQQPVLGGTPTERTEVRIVYDRDHLYMGVICYDSEPDRLLGNTMKRDEFLSADDRFMWTMDTFLDQRSGYFFEMNPSGLMADALMGAGGGNSREWDGIWNAKVRRSEIGWTLEIDIPFSTLNFDLEAPAWGINFQRTVRRKNEENLWTGHNFNQGLRRMSNAGLLIGIEGVSQGVGLDLKPYVGGSLADAPGRTPAVVAKGTADAGVDVAYNLTPGLRANLTVNTDFAETEVDQRRVNLTRFPLFFPEKRSFFLDGATFFDFYLARSLRSLDVPVQPFFSRRIGLGAGGTPQSIELGAKLTGQAGAYDVGVLYVRTGRERDRVGEDFAVVRVKRRILEQSSVGGVYTLRHAREPAARAVQTAGVDFRLATSRFRGSDNLELDGFVLANTSAAGGGESLTYGAQLSYPNDRWDARLAFNEVPAGHAPAVGFTPRAGYRQYRQGLRFAPRPRRHPWIRQVAVGGEVDLLTDMTNRLLTRELTFTALRIDTHRQDSVELFVVPQSERLERDFEIRPGIVLPIGSEYDVTRYRVSVATANRRIVATRSSVEWGGFFSGDRREIAVSVGIRPRPGVTLSLEGESNRVRLREGRFETRLYRLVADTQFSPWMYLVNNVQYDSVSGGVGWQARFRWIMRPGNDFFFVYTHNWQDQPEADRLGTLDRRAATKIVYTHRF